MRLGYTDKARTALHLAEKAAKKLHQSYVGTEHILLGLIQENTGVAARVLIENGAGEKEIIELIKDFVAPDSTTAIAERGGYSPRAVAVLEEAESIAIKYRSELIGTEHILLGIIREGENVGARLLTTVGINTGKLYVDVLVAMGEDGKIGAEELKNKSNYYF